MRKEEFLPTKKLKQIELNFKNVLVKDNTNELANRNIIENENHETSGTDETTSKIYIGHKIYSKERFPRPGYK